MASTTLCLWRRRACGQLPTLICMLVLLLTSIRQVCPFSVTKYRQWMARTHSAAGRRDTSRLQAEAGSGKFLDIMSGGKDPQVTPEERVLSLVGKLNETTARNDFISPLWETIKYEASVIVEGDLKAATILANSVLSQPSFEDAVIDLVANHLESPLLQATQIKNLFREICEKNETLQHIWASDILATTLRDSSQPNAISVLLFDQGFHSLVTYRFANCLWYSGRDGLSLFFQSLASRLFGSDIHPACQIGHSCVVACGTGVVIGETARIGNDCFVGHGVTLGGTGKESGDRHPKIGNGVYLSSGATVLGNIHVGEGSVVNAGSVVTKTTPPYCRVGGVPAGIISKFSVDPESIESMNNEKFEIPRELTGQGEDEEPIKFSSFNIDFQGDLESRTGMS